LKAETLKDASGNIDAYLLPDSHLRALLRKRARVHALPSFGRYRPNCDPDLRLQLAHPGLDPLADFSDGWHGLLQPDNKLYLTPAYNTDYLYQEVKTYNPNGFDFGDDRYPVTISSTDLVVTLLFGDPRSRGPDAAAELLYQRGDRGRASRIRL
jgi:hypothetical protein